MNRLVTLLFGLFSLAVFAQNPGGRNTPDCRLRSANLAQNLTQQVFSTLQDPEGWQNIGWFFTEQPNIIMVAEWCTGNAGCCSMTLNPMELWAASFPYIQHNANITTEPFCNGSVRISGIYTLSYPPAFRSYAFSYSFYWIPHGWTTLKLDDVRILSYACSNPYINNTCTDCGYQANPIPSL